MAATEQLDVELDTRRTGRDRTSAIVVRLDAHCPPVDHASSSAQLASDAGHEFADATRPPSAPISRRCDRRADDLRPEQRTELLEAAITEVGELSTFSAELVDLASDAGRSQEADADGRSHRLGDPA